MNYFIIKYVFLKVEATKKTVLLSRILHVNKLDSAILSPLEFLKSVFNINVRKRLSDYTPSFSLLKGV